ncbi:Rho guanine nucleotide exchange factor [Trema orientale]|uniref:Rho guanine nucleotide exchange factor n=1 Tax=Trema orientale TaxID=63057 RepID=A0A2P5FUT7_TREOI|nr:Rho guanine nucleotide exchange factor [Trema orientale]
MASSVTLEELRLFHTIDREAYSRLMNSLGYGSRSSMIIVAFWNWVERCGHRDFVYLTQFLPYSLLKVLVSETITCIASLYVDLPLILPCVPTGLELSFMPNFLGTDFSLNFVQQNKDFAKRSILHFMKDVGQWVFSDIVPETQRVNLDLLAQKSGYGLPAQSLLTTQMENVPLLSQEEDNMAQMPSTQMVNLCLSAQEAGNGPPAQPEPTSQMENLSVSSQEEDNMVVPSTSCSSSSGDLAQNERALFMTFSKGHPVCKDELNDFITRQFGDCIEAIYMKVEEKKQALFARVVVKSLEVITRILRSQRIAKFSVNGKDVWVRRYVSKRPIGR